MQLGRAGTNTAFGFSEAGSVSTGFPVPGDLEGVEGWGLPRGLHSLGVLRLRGGRDEELSRLWAGRWDAGPGCSGSCRGLGRGIRERRGDAYLVTWPQVSSCPRGSAPRSTRGCAGQGNFECNGFSEFCEFLYESLKLRVFLKTSQTEQ